MDREPIKNEALLLECDVPPSKTLEEKDKACIVVHSEQGPSQYRTPKEVPGPSIGSRSINIPLLRSKDKGQRSKTIDIICGPFCPVPH